MQPQDLLSQAFANIHEYTAISNAPGINAHFIVKAVSLQDAAKKYRAVLGRSAMTAALDKDGIVYSDAWIAQHENTYAAVLAGKHEKQAAQEQVAALLAS